MRLSNCQFDASVVHAATTGEWSEALKVHVTSCAQCSDTMKLVLALHQAAKEVSLPSTLPDSRLIWMKAQVIRKQNNLNRLDLLSKLSALIVGIAVVAIAAMWKLGVLGFTLGPEGSSPEIPWIRFMTATLPYTVAGATFLVLRLIMQGRTRGRAMY
jgi:hypothetical protein